MFTLILFWTGLVLVGVAALLLLGSMIMTINDGNDQAALDRMSVIQRILFTGGGIVMLSLLLASFGVH